MGIDGAFALLFDRNPVPLFVYDIETLRFVAANEAALALYGCPREVFLAQSLIDLLPADRRAQLGGRFEPAAPGIEKLGVRQHLCADGHVIDVDLLRAEINLDGRPAALICAKDVTDAVKAAKAEAQLRAELSAAHAALQAANQALEQRVEQRTAELRAAQDALLRKERLSVLGQLTATVAHELRNPLSAIRNSLFVLRDITTSLGAAVERPMARMERSIERCNAIIGDLLDFTRDRPLEQSAICLNEWLAEVLDEQPLPAAVTLERRLGATDNVRVMLDADRFRRVIINLVENAAQAMDAAEVALTERRIMVSTSVNDDGITIAMTDTGPGIAPDILEKVFEPLFSTKRFGTGLGLPTVKQIVEQHGGSIAIRSTVGQGTSICIQLPLQERAVAAA